MKQATSWIGKVMKNPAGGYDVDVPGFGVLSNLQTEGRYKWEDEQWVTAERAGSVWRIVGPAPARA